jgi:hypothetical protein
MRQQGVVRPAASGRAVRRWDAGEYAAYAHYEPPLGTSDAGLGNVPLRHRRSGRLVRPGPAEFGFDLIKVLSAMMLADAGRARGGDAGNVG